MDDALFLADLERVEGAVFDWRHKTLSCWLMIDGGPFAGTAPNERDKASPSRRFGLCALSLN
jgi:hypothetical protein